jgi:hypothetical protein
MYMYMYVAAKDFEESPFENWRPGMTRFVCKFSPIGRLLWANFLNNMYTIKIQIWATVSTVNFMYYFYKNVFGYMLGDLFTSSSDHPGQDIK